tara:strand:+ start:7161 stop:7931 length:771 start_codon:yes stop_codon:yes gene_type:complete
MTIKIAFIFIVNIFEEYLEKNLNLLKRYNQDIYAVENNSVDDTKNILKRSGIKKVVTLDLDKNSSLQLCRAEETNCIARVRRLAYIRQQGLDAVLSSGIDYDYICMLDLDFVSYDEQQLVDMFEFMQNNKDVDGIFGMSYIKYLNVPYDIAAVKPWYRVPVIAMGFKRHVAVDSAFSGFGIYRCSSIKNKDAKYDYKTIKDIEHIHFNRYFDNLVVDTQFNPLYHPSDPFFGVKLALVILVLIIIALWYIKLRRAS